MGNIKVLMEQIRQMIKSYVDNALKNYPRVVSASVISIKDKQAVVRMPYATDASSDFTAYVVTSQLVSVGDVVNVAYWSSLSTAVVLANTSTESASIGVAGDYNTLENKPVVNGVTLSGEKTSADLKLYGDGNEPKYPVTSVNGKIGAVVLTADDVGALSDTTVVPTKTSDLTNDSGYITPADVPVKSVAGRTGEVVLSKSDVGLGSVDNVRQYSASNPPPYPVTSVDGSTGAVTTNAVKTTTQTLTAAQQQQARTNIGAGTSSFDGNYNSLTNKPTIPSKTSQLENDSDFATETQVNAKYTKPADGIPKSDLAQNVQNSLGKADTALQEAPVTSVDGSVGAVVTNAVKTTTQTLTNAQKQQARENIGAGTSSFSGNYNDLTNKPSIPTKTSELTNDSDFATTTQVDAKYTKPANGIPKTDLTQDVQNSLSKADTALQSAPVTSVNDKTGDVVLSKTDVGLGNVDNVKQYSANNPPPYPVTSVDGATGAITTNAVKTTTQTLTEQQKQQARTNIGAGVSSFSGSYNDLTNKPSIPTKTSELTNDSDFATIAQVNVKYTKPASGIPKTDLTKTVQDSLSKADTALQSAPVTSVNDKTGDVVLSKGDVGLGNVDNVKQYSASNPPPYPVTSVDGATGAITTNAVKTTTQTLTTAQQQQARTNIGAGTSSFSGSYNDLTNKPAIPTKTSELENDSNFATIAQVNAKYTKPTAGIPETDLSKDVQDSLAKADTALQSAPVTSVNSKTGAVALTASDVGAVSTGNVTQTLGTSTTKVPSEKAVSDAMSSAGYGDMLKATYDPTNVVADGGGIALYVATELKSYLKYTIRADGGVTLIFDD